MQWNWNVGEESIYLNTNTYALYGYVSGVMSTSIQKNERDLETRDKYKQKTGKNDKGQKYKCHILTSADPIAESIARVIPPLNRWP